MHVHFDSARNTDRGDFPSYGALMDALFYRAERVSRDREPDCAVRLASREIGGLLLTEVSRPSGASSRATSNMHQDPIDTLFVSVLDSGRAMLEADMLSVLQTPGDVIMWRASQPHRWNYDCAMSSTCVRIPRAWLRIGDPDALANRTLAGDTPMGALAASVVRQVAALPAPATGAVAARLRSSLLDTLIAALSVVGSESPDTAKTEGAKDYMLARLDDTELEVTQVARALGLSPRTLARLFAAEGTTPARWLWRERLARARQLLDSDDARSVTDVALACGFTNLSHFSRAFRAAHGEPPRARRARPAST